MILRRFVTIKTTQGAQRVAIEHSEGAKWFVLCAKEDVIVL